MNRYTIYCTKEQTRKALELGAPLLRIERVTNTCTNYCKLFNKITIDKIWYHIPTTEQMIGWIEEQESIKEVSIYCDVTGSNWSFEGYKDNGGYAFVGRDSYFSRKEATLAAIDAAMKYLVDNDLIK